MSFRGREKATQRILAFGWLDGYGLGSLMGRLRARRGQADGEGASVKTQKVW
jgi:hypothetical protein